MGTPIPSNVNETRGQGAGEVKTIKLTPEEMDREMERLNRGRSVINNLSGKEREPKVKPTKEAYLKALSEGKSVSRIETMFGIKAAGLGYWLGEWGLKDPEVEKTVLAAYVAAQTETESAPPKSEEEQTKEVRGKRGPAPKEGPSCGLTKKDLLKAISDGETLSSVEKAWGMKYNTIHDWIKRWGLKGISPGKARELLGNLDADASKSEADSVVQNDVAISDETKEKIQQRSDAILNLTTENEKLHAENEHLRACSKNEIAFLKAASETIDELQDKVNALELEREEWEAKANNFKTQLIGCEAERDQAVKLLEVMDREQATKKVTAPENSISAPVTTQAFVSFALPLILIAEEPAAKRDRALERVCDLNERIMTGDVDYPRLVKETFELLQVVVSLVHAQTNDLTVKPEKVVGLVNEFFSHYNSLHIKRMEELAAEFEWVTVEA